MRLTVAAGRRAASGVADGSQSGRSINIGLRNVVATILIALGLVFVWEIRGTLMLTFAAVVLVVLFTMPVRLLMRRFEMNRLVAIVVSVCGFFVILVLIGLSILPIIVNQFDELANNVIPSGVEVAREAITREALLEHLPSSSRCSAAITKT